MFCGNDDNKKFIFGFGLVPHVIDWGGSPFFFNGNERFLWDLVLSLEIVEGNRSA